MTIDFTNCLHNKYRSYGGSNGNKLAVIYNNENYMIKFPNKPKYITDISYANSCISEYIGCNIFKSTGFETQETMLGKYHTKNGFKIVVACKDFVSLQSRLMPFSELKNKTIDSSHNGFGTEMSDILETIETQSLMSSKEVKEYFWNMFIVDSLIGNFDRHNGNWGFIVNELQGEVQFSPIYDCGSGLYPQISEKQMLDVMSDENKINERIFVFPTSQIKLNNTKINYFDFISSLNNRDCNFALKTMYQKIQMDKIFDIVDSTPLINDVQKEFYKLMLKERKEKILDFSYNKLLEQQKKIKKDIER